MNRLLTRAAPRPTVVLLACSLALVAQPVTSRWVYPGPGGRLQYGATAMGDRIPDFSQVGYRGGEEPLPDTATLFTPERVILVEPPASGDSGVLIQAAIDNVSALPPDDNGWRGMVRLAAGEYRIPGQLRIRAGGVVLCGQGEGEGGALLRATGTGQRPLILVDPGSGSPRKLAGTERRIADKYVPVGATSFRLESTQGFLPGDQVIVFRPSTAEWIRDLGMDRIPGKDTVQWTPGSKDLKYERVITRIESDRVFLNAPVCNSLDQRYGGGSVYKYEFPQRIRRVGLENLAGISDFASPSDEDHAWDFIRIDRTQHAWVRNITARYFAYAAVNLGENASYVTVQDAACLDPVSQVTGGRRYSFNVDGQMNLVQRVRTRAGRHDFVQGSLTYGPNVFLRSRAEKALDESGPHHRWSTGTLFDNIVVEGGALAAWNRADMGTGHGWSGANMVFWNCAAKLFRVQNPFTAQNWVIGGIGGVDQPRDYLKGPLGIYDAHGTPVSLGDPQGNPDSSLYVAQLRDRLAGPGAQLREYALGDYDSYSEDGAGSDDEVPVDEQWLSAVRQFAAAQNSSVARFDVAAPRQFVPFTFTFGLESQEQIVAATLTLALKPTGNLTGEEAIWLAGWDAALRVTFRSDEGIAVIDLSGDRLALLRAGRLNGAIGPGVAVDWARLELIVTAAP